MSVFLVARIGTSSLKNVKYCTFTRFYLTKMKKHITLVKYVGILWKRIHLQAPPCGADSCLHRSVKETK